MKNVLAFDTSNTSLQICLKKDHQIYENFRECGLMHAQMLMVQIDLLLKEAELDKKELELIVCGIGPGSFTGMRIGLSTAKGLCSALNIPLKCVSLLDVYAVKNRHWPGSVVPVIDARKKRFYGAVYENGERTGDYFDLDPEDIICRQSLIKPVLICGPDGVLLKDNASDEIVISEEGQISAGKHLLELGEAEYSRNGKDDLNISPLYIRKSDAELAREKQR